MGKTIDDILDRVGELRFEEEFDLIVAIANGGIIPAAIVNQRLNVDLRLLRINLRDEMQRPVYDSPRLLREIDFEYKGKTILLVEDRVKTGATLEYAKSLLEGARVVKTLAVNGPADYSLYDEDCFRMPWKVKSEK